MANLSIRWSNGNTEMISNVPADQLVVIREGCRDHKQAEILSSARLFLRENDFPSAPKCEILGWSSPVTEVRSQSVLMISRRRTLQALKHN